MKPFLIITALFLSLAFVGCKKESNPTPQTNNNVAFQSSDYDNANKIFRVKASSSGVAYTITVKRTPQSNPNAVDIQQGNQSTGDAFEYPFTPNLGDKIEITAQSTTGNVYLYALYKGAVLSGVNTQKNSTGGTTATFSYTVTN
jgi:hypothetical protein